MRCGPSAFRDSLTQSHLFSALRCAALHWQTGSAGYVKPSSSIIIPLRDLFIDSSPLAARASLCSPLLIGLSYLPGLDTSDTNRNRASCSPSAHLHGSIGTLMMIGGVAVPLAACLLAAGRNVQRSEVYLLAAVSAAGRATSQHACRTFPEPPGSLAEHSGTRLKPCRLSCAEHLCCPLRPAAQQTRAARRFEPIADMYVASVHSSPRW
jgi:hypothetical protein